MADGPNASYITATSLDRWEKRLDDLFKGQSYDIYAEAELRFCFSGVTIF
jgi:hypothetical protein